MKTYIRNFTKFTSLNEGHKENLRDWEVQDMITRILGYFSMSHKKNLGSVGMFLLGKDDSMESFMHGMPTDLSGILDVLKGTKYEEDFMGWVTDLNNMWRAALPPNIPLNVGTKIDKSASDIALPVDDLKMKWSNLYELDPYQTQWDEEKVETVETGDEKTTEFSDEESSFKDTFPSGN